MDENFIRDTILFYTKGLSEDDIITLIARELLNIDYGKNLFKEGMPDLWYEEDDRKKIIYYPRDIVILINKGIISTDNTDLILFGIQAKAYEIIKTILDKDFSEGMHVRVKDQHIAKYEVKIPTFQCPFINISFEVVKLTKSMQARPFIMKLNGTQNTDVVKIIVHDYDFLKPSPNNSFRRIIYVKNNINDIIKFNIVSVIHPFKKHQILDDSNSNLYRPWNIYESKEELVYLDGKLCYNSQPNVFSEVNIMHDYAFEEGLLTYNLTSSKYELYSINYKYTLNGIFARVKIPITFEQIKNEFINKLDPVSLYPIEDKSVYLKLFEENSAKIFDNLKSINANDGDIVFVHDKNK